MQSNKLKILILGVIGIYFSYFVGSIVQERMYAFIICRMKLPYENISTLEKRNFQSTNSFILFPSFVAWLTSTLYTSLTSASSQKSASPPSPPSCPTSSPTATASPAEKEWLKISILIVVSAYCMTKAIYLTNYPLVILFKSCNLLSVISVGVFCSRVSDKRHKLGIRQFGVGVVVTVGVLLYYMGDILRDGGQVRSYWGIGLLCVSLLLDGIIPDFQAHLKQSSPQSPTSMSQHLNLYKFVVSLLYSMSQNQLPYLYNFFKQSPQCFLDMLLLCICGTIGQIFIYWIINNFRQHVVPFIITTRKIFTVAISVIWFRHAVGLGQVVGVVIVFCAVLLQFYWQITDQKNQQTQHSKQQKLQKQTQLYEVEPERDSMMGLNLEEVELKEQVGKIGKIGN